MKEHTYTPEQKKELTELLTALNKAFSDNSVPQQRNDQHAYKAAKLAVLLPDSEAKEEIKDCIIEMHIEATKAAANLIKTLESGLNIHKALFN